MPTITFAGENPDEEASEKPSNLQITDLTTYSSQATLTWAPPSGSTGTEEYLVYVNGGKKAQVSEESYQFTDIAPNTGYTIYVRAIYEDGTMSEASDPLVVTTGYVTMRTVGEGQQYATIQAAVDETKPGDVVLVKDGTYKEDITINRSGTAGSYITIMAEGDNALINGKIDISASYIRLAGFKMDGYVDGEYVGPAIAVYGHYTQVVGNDIRNYRGQGVRCEWVNASHAYVADNYIYKCSYGFYTCSDSIFERNEVEYLDRHGASGDADYIRAFGVNVIIRDNYCHGTVSGEHIEGAHVDFIQVFDEAGPSKNILVENNIVTGHYAQGIMMENDYYGPEVANISDWTVRNNVFRDFFAYAICGGKAGGGIPNLRVENNLFIGNASNKGIMFVGTGGSGIVKNNIIINCGVSYEAISSAVINDAGNNIIYNSGLPKVMTSTDIIGEDPLIIDPENNDFRLHPQSPAIDRGAEVDYRYDIRGNARPYGEGFDIGPYEFQGFEEGMPPIAEITFPENGRSYLVGSDINIAVNVDGRNGIQRVEYFLNDAYIGQSAETPFGFEISDIQEGMNKLYCIAYDGDGLHTKSPVVVFYANDEPGWIIASDDTYIMQTSPTGNYNKGSGGSTGDIIEHLTGGSTGNLRLIYLKFDISSLAETGQINNAKLNIYAKNQGNNKNTLNVYGVDDTSWAERALTWNTAPQTDFSGSTPIASAQIDKEGIADVYRYYELDITDYVTEQYNNGKSHITLVFNLAEPYRYVRIQSKDLVDTQNEGPNPPYLIVNRGFIDNEPPSTPQNLQGTALSESEIELSWDSSTDNTGVAGYTVYCDDEEIATLGPDAYLGYVVGGLTAETTYGFSVVAFDAAGNLSGRSDAVTVTTLGEPSVQPGQILPTDDTYIWQGSPNKNYNNGSGGSTGEIIEHISGGATGNFRLTYMKFDISSLDEIGQIDNVVLNIYAKNQGNYKNTLNVYGVEDTSWAEGELTWNNAPQTDFSESTPIASVQVDKESAANVNRYYELDITDYVTEQYNDGKSYITLVFKLVEPYRYVIIQSKDLVDMPNEGPNPPYLIVNGESDMPVLAESVNIPEDNITLDVGHTYTLAATVFPENAANKELEWESSDPLVAAVDANGLVSAVSAGTATITVKVAGTEIQDTCTVTVKPAQAEGMTITAPDEIAPEKNFIATIGFNLNKTILTAGLTISYNPGLVTYEGYEQIEGGLFVAGTKHDANTGTIKVLLSGTDNPITSGTPLVKLEFVSKDTEGSFEIAITEAELLDVPGNSIFPGPASRTIAVNYVIPGDANDDGTVNLLDLHFVSTHFWKDTSSADWYIAKAGDVNNDGHIGIEDLVYVAEKILQQ